MVRARTLGRFACVIVPTAVGVVLWVIIGRGAAPRGVDIAGEDGIAAESMVLGPFGRIAGMPFVRAELRGIGAARSGPIGSMMSSARSGVVRNHLFLQSGDLESRWLLPDDRSLFRDCDELRARHDVEASVVALYYSLVREDSDGDNHLTARDLHDVALSRQDGSGFTVVLSRVDQIHGHFMDPADRLIVIYRQDGADRVAAIDVAASAVLMSRPLAARPNG